MKKEKLLYFFYNRLNDPLLQSNIFLYINELATENKYDVSIITYEDKNCPLSTEELKNYKKQFAAQGISWHPLNWHSGTNLILKFMNLISGLLKIFYLATFKGYKNVITLGSVAGSFVYLISKFVKIKIYLYQYEPHSEFELDNNIWGEKSNQFKLLNSFEKKSAKAAVVISSGTEYMRKRLQDWQTKGEFIKLTSVVNNRLFVFSEADRNEIRTKYNIPESGLLVIYPGKLGELYYGAKELINLFKVLKEKNTNFYFLIITPNQKEVLAELNNHSQILKNAITLLAPVNYSQVPSYLSAADLGIVAIPPTPSQKFRSPIKVGEYLMCGLPYLVCKGVSEDDLVAVNDKVGVVVENFSESEISNSYEKIIDLLSVSKFEMNIRCRKVGIEYRGFEKQYLEFKKALTLLTKKH